MTPLPFGVFGESLVDVTRQGAVTSVRPGGSPLNVAVGLARLGASVEFATQIGDDEHGRAILAHLRDAGVRLVPGSVTEGTTSVAEATIGPAGSASYRFGLAWKPSARAPSRVGAAHLGSVSSVLEPGASTVLEWARSVPATSVVSFDPNVRPSITGTGQALRAAVDRAAGIADLIKVSSDDLDHLADPSLPARWLTGRASVVVVTSGDQGARIVTRTGDAVVGAPRVSVADTIGAGDSFMAGLLFSLAGGGLMTRVALAGAGVAALTPHVEFAVRCSAVTVQRAGADPPALAELVAAGSPLPLSE